MHDDLVRERAQTLLSAHHTGAAFTPFSGGAALPSLAAAYAVQRRYVELLAAREASPVAGYKIGLTSPRMQALCGIDSPIAGAVLANRLHLGAQTLHRAAYGRLGIEFEIGVRVGRDLPAAAAPYDFATVATAVHAVAPAIEVIDDRCADYQGLDMASLIADNAWNAGIVLGAWQSAWPDLASVEAVVQHDGVELDRGHGRDVLGHPIHALTWLANHLATQGDGLRAGDVVATGSIVPTHFPAGPAAYAYAITGLGQINLTIVD